MSNILNVSLLMLLIALCIEEPYNFKSVNYDNEIINTVCSIWELR